MNPLPGFAHSFAQNPRWTALFLDASLKSLVVLAAAAGLCCCWRRAASATRHLIWFLAVASLPFLPLLASVQPSWHRPIWSVSTRFSSGNEFALALDLAPGAEPGATAHGYKSRRRTGRTCGPEPGCGESADRRSLQHELARRCLQRVALRDGAGVDFPDRRAVSPWKTRTTGASAAERRLVAPSQEASETLRLRRRVALWQSAHNVMPLTWGWWRPVVLLPAEAGQWPAERRRIVLLHELAHVKRWDCLTQLIAGVVCALYWFNPLVMAGGAENVRRAGAGLRRPGAQQRLQGVGLRGTPGGDRRSVPAARRRSRPLPWLVPRGWKAG